jgi:outer membrane protein TolC
MAATSLFLGLTLTTLVQTSPGDSLTLDRALARAERVPEMTEKRYAHGVGIQLDVLEAEAELRRARTALVGALHAHRFAGFELRRALGLPADAVLLEAIEAWATRCESADVTTGGEG